MKSRNLIALLLLLLTTSALAEGLLEAPDLRQWVAEATPPDGVTLEMVETAHGTRLEIENTRAEPTSVVLAELETPGLSDTEVRYTARMGSTGLSGTAYLEMWAVAGENAWFSRALNDTFSGDSVERATSTPFFLQAEDTIESLRLGVRFEGPGRVTLGDISLSTGDHRPMLSHAMAGVIGSLFGLGSALWATLACFFVWKGRARVPVLSITLGLVFASGAALLSALVLWRQDLPWLVWYLFALLGAIGFINFGLGYMVLHWWYSKAEARRMDAMDLR